MFGVQMKNMFFVLGLVGLYALPILNRELFSPGFGVGIIFLLLLLVSLVLVVRGSIAIIRRHKSKRVAWVGGLFFVFWIPLFWSGWLFLLGDHLYFLRREGKLKLLIDRLEQYETIEHLNDGRRHFKTVNGFHYLGPGKNPSNAMPLPVALDSAGVSVEAYEDVLERIRDIGVFSVTTYDGRTDFVIGGFLDNYSGILYTPLGEPEYGDDAPRGKIINLVQVAPDWWLYRTT